MNYAIVKNGVVYAKTYIDSSEREVLGVRVEEGIDIRVGDEYRDGKFYRSGEELEMDIKIVLEHTKTELQTAQAETETARAETQAEKEKTAAANETIQTMQTAAQALDDATALLVPQLFPAWGEGSVYTAGQKLTYNGTLYRVLQGHTAQSNWTPDAAPSLFAAILAGQDGTGIGEWVQPDSTNPYSKGDRVTYQGKTWESTADGNVWAPGVYGWKEVE